MSRFWPWPVRFSAGTLCKSTNDEWRLHRQFATQLRVEQKKLGAKTNVLASAPDLPRDFVETYVRLDEARTHLTLVISLCR
jgi:hypothetical protein